MEDEAGDGADSAADPDAEESELSMRQWTLEIVLRNANGQRRWTISPCAWDHSRLANVVNNAFLIAVSDAARGEILPD